VIYQFGDYSLDTGSLELKRRGDLVALEPQVFRLIVCLIKNRDRVVSKDELIDMVWDRRIVSDGALNTRINSARSAVGDNGKTQAVIKTFPRRGFRFVADAVEVQPTTAAPGTEPLPLPDKPSIAVLAFENLSGDREQEYFADGLAEDIITGLSKFHWFFVIARNSSFTYKGSAVDVKQVARELGVQYVLEGSVRKSGNRVRITAQLIDALTGRHVWAERYDRDLEDVFAVQGRPPLHSFRQKPNVSSAKLQGVLMLGTIACVAIGIFLIVAKTTLWKRDVYLRWPSILTRTAPWPSTALLSR
jgi:TolB-like protein